jgi:hypothetical protein
MTAETTEKTRAVSPIVDTPIAADEMTVSQAATRLGLTRNAILHTIWTGHLPAVRRANPVLPVAVYYVREADVDATLLRPKVAGRAGKPGPRKKKTWSRRPKKSTPVLTVQEIADLADAGVTTELSRIP